MNPQESTDFSIRMEKVRFAYEAAEVLKGIDLELTSGCFFGLLGPNGAGKTTVVQILSGALRADSGLVRIMGREMNSWDRREIAGLVAVVPQKFELAFPFTVQEVVLLGRAPHRGALALDRPRDLEIAHDAMRATGVAHLGKRRMHELSGGEFKRVVVAKALAQEPKILLLDEPAAHLDIRHQVTLYDLIEDIRGRTGVTVVSAMHDLNLAAAYCNQVALLKEGQLVRTGSIEEVMTYQHLREVFEIDIYVGVNELTGHRLFTPMIGEKGEKS